MLGGWGVEGQKVKYDSRSEAMIILHYEITNPFASLVAEQGYEEDLKGRILVIWVGGLMEDI